jgi:MFS family permease
MRKPPGWLVRMSVLFIFLLNVEVSLVNTALGEISKAFPDADPVLINLVSTSAVFFMFVMSFAMGRFASRFNKKHLVIVGLVIYIIGGVGGFFMSHSIEQLIFSRALVGIGAGMTAPLVGAIVCELYEGRDRATMLGWANGFDSLLAVFLTMLAGWLGAINWRYTFLAYAVFVLVLLLEVAVLPSLPPQTMPAGGAERAHFTRHQRAKLVLVAAFVFMNLMAGMMLFLKTPILITQEGLGGPLQIASAFSANTAGACISAIAFGWVFRVFRRYTMVVYTTMTAVAFLIVLNSHTVSLIMLGFLINGLAMGLFIPSIEMKAITTGSRANIAKAMSVVFGALFLGQFAASFMEKALALFGDPTPRTMLTLSFVMFCLFTVAYLVWVRAVPEERTDLDPAMRGHAVEPEVEPEVEVEATV